MEKRKLYQTIADEINAILPLGKVQVLDTPNHGKYCDTVSLYVDDELYEMLYTYRDATTVATIHDRTFTINGKRYYIEAYTSWLLNLAQL